jgi:hypothetical protein
MLLHNEERYLICDYVNTWAIDYLNELAFYFRELNSDTYARFDGPVHVIEAIHKSSYVTCRVFEFRNMDMDYVRVALAQSGRVYEIGTLIEDITSLTDHSCIGESGHKVLSGDLSERVIAYLNSLIALKTKV